MMRTIKLGTVILLFSLIGLTYQGCGKGFQSGDASFNSENGDASNSENQNHDDPPDPEPDSTPKAKLLYENDFTNETNDPKKLGAFPGNIDIQYSPKSLDVPEDISIVKDPLSGIESVLKVFMIGGEKGLNLEGDGITFKHRAMLKFGSHLSNDMDRSVPRATGGDGLRFLPDREYWFGAKVLSKPNSVAQEKYSTLNFFMWGLMGATVGDPAIMIDGNGRWTVMAERYKDENGVLKEKKDHVTVSNNIWHDVVIRIIRKPYSLGTYRKGQIGGTRSGTFELWVDGKKEISYINALYTGTDREHKNEFNPYFRWGIYWGPELRSGAEYNMYYDKVKVAEGDNGYDLVAP